METSDPSPFTFVSAIDRDYVVPHSVFLTSFRDHNASRATSYVLHYDLSADDQAYLEAVGTHAEVPVRFVRLPAYPFLLFKTRRRSSLGSRDRMSPIAYAKAFIDRFLPSTLDEVVVVDADIVVTGSLLGLPEERKDAPVAAVANIPRLHHHQFNSGVMVVDLRSWRDLGVGAIAERFLLSYSDSLHSHDQHVLNLIFKGAWAKIGLQWNYMEDYFRFQDRATAYSWEEIRAARRDPAIIHYAVGTDKPWRRDCQHPAADVYRAYHLRLGPVRAGFDLRDPQEPGVN